jgi:hypothetical protein
VSHPDRAHPAALAFTGLATAALTSAATLALVAGGLFLLLGRRRRDA